MLVIRQKTAVQGQPPASLAAARQAVFEIPGIRRLFLDAEKSSDDAGDYLSRQVARKPEDLRSHLQRINLCLQQRDREGTYGALLDLFIVLGPKGLPLRRRIFRSTLRLLNKEQYRAFLQHMDAGVHATAVMPSARCSMLSKGLTGTSHLVINEVTEEDFQRDPLIEAREHLEYGQVEEARELLEEAVLMEPWRTDLQSDLLEIYRHTRDRKNFDAMRERLEAANIPVSDAWLDASNLIEQVVIR